MKRWIVLEVALAMAVVCAGAPTAVAARGGGAGVFAQCPVHAAEVDGCLYAPIEGGYIKLGKTVVPVGETVVLQAGMLENEPSYVKPLAGALDGETLTRAAQLIPGGLFGSPLDAVTELAAPASSIMLVSAEPIRLALPIKVRLVNPLLGAECSIGSNAHPIELDLTTGTTSGGFTGSPGTSRTIDNGRIEVLSGVSLVASGFAVPKAGGCGLAVVDEALDAKLGLPASKNTVVTFNATIEVANSEVAEES